MDGDLAASDIGYVPQFSIAYDPLTVDESVEASTKLRVKVRDNEYDPRLRELVITARGISLPDTFAGTRELLSGSARADAALRRPSPSGG